MYGGTAEGVDLLLYYHLELIAFCLGREDEIRGIVADVHEREGCQSASFAFHYRRNRPEARKDETARYVVGR